MVLPTRRGFLGAATLALTGCAGASRPSPASPRASAAPAGHEPDPDPPRAAIHPAARRLEPAAPDPELRALLAEVSPERLEQTVRRLAAFGTRHTLSSQTDPGRGIGAARDYLASEMRRWVGPSQGRLEVRLDSFLQPPAPRVPRPTPITNVVATLRGPDAGRYYVVSGHYDSRNGDVMDAVGDAPGADDDASGVAVVLELCRLLSVRPLRGSVVLAAVAGEEQGLLGARHLAEQLVSGGAGVVAMLTNDIVGSATAHDGQSSPHAVRVFAEGVPTSETAEQARVRQAVGGESDSPSRQLARYVREVAGGLHTEMDVRVVHRRDRYLRGGDHIAFLERGVAAVRLTEPHEDFDHQHQNVRVENGVQYGDLPRFCDFDYLARVARVNLATVWCLANAPAAPENVRLLAGDLGYHTELSWDVSPDADVAGYEVLWRQTVEPFWTQVAPVGKAGHVRLQASKDDLFFAVRAVGQGGLRSPARFPVPVR